MKKTLPDLTKTNILVVGDLMIDRYIYGHANRISPESPVPVVLSQSTENRLGGAANVALNLINLGCNVSLMGFAGEDNNSRILINEIEKNSIKNFLLIEKEYKTIIKTRIVSNNQQLLRLDEEIKVGEHQTKIEFLESGNQNQEDIVLKQEQNEELNSALTEA